MQSIAKKVVFAILACLVWAEAIVYCQTKAPTTVKTIFDYKQDLNLTDRQEQDIKTILQDLSKDVRVARAKLTLIDVEASDLIKNDGDLEQIRKRLKDAADIQVGLKMVDIVATRKINKVLSPEQLKKWRSLQAAVQPQAK